MRYRQRAFTLTEVLTALIVVAVLVAIAIPMWRNHLVRVQRTEAVTALVAVQTEQDNYFGRNARYADGPQLTAPRPGGLGLENRSKRGAYSIEVRSNDDGLGYVATARVVSQGTQSEDRRCVEMTLDQNGRRRAVDSEGKDRSADCWH